MKLSTPRPTKLLLGAALAVGVVLAAGCGNGSISHTQQTPTIAFVAPPSGATAEVGKTITIQLDVTNAAAFKDGIYVVGQGEIGTVRVPTQPPYEATLAVPSDLELGNYTLTAAGQASSSATPITASTTVKVVPNPEIPVEIQLPQGGLAFEAIGERLPITVPGATKGLEYASDAPSIATVSGAGIVTAQNAGTASIAVSLNKSIVGFVPIKVLAPPLLPSPTSLDFGSQGKGTTSSPQSVTITNDASYPVSVLEVKTGTVFPTSEDCVSSSPLAPGASCTVNVSFAPTATGAVNGALEIIGSATIAPTRILLSGTGT